MVIDDMYNFNMLCSCVSRDIFEIKGEDENSETPNHKKYQINHYANFVSPIFSSDPGYDINGKIFSEIMVTYKETFPKYFSDFK